MMEDALAPWVTTVPAHWHVRRLGSVANVIFSNVDKHVLQSEVPVRLCNYTDVYKNDRVTSTIDFMHASALPREIEKFQVRKDDVLATKDSEDPNDIAVSSLIAEDLPGVLCGYHLAMVRPDQELLCGPFLAWVQASKKIRAQYEACAVGVTRFGLGQSAFKSVYLPLPPLLEQRRIASYLDEQTAKIDRLMDLRRRQMELLKEQRAAIIQQAVTRGLNPDSPMKDSGLPWLREIPAHWAVKRLKYLTPQVTVGIVINPSSHYVESGIPCLRSLNVNPGELLTGELVFINESSHRLLSKSAIYHGDIVAVRTGQPGTTAVVDERFHNANCIDLIIIRRSRHFVSEYVQLLLNSSFARSQFDSGSDGAIQQHFNIQTAKNLVVLLPPLEEQEDILRFIEHSNARLDALFTAYSRQLDVLSEYRAALIHECVTGQRRVGEMIDSEAL